MSDRMFDHHDRNDALSDTDWESVARVIAGEGDQAEVARVHALLAVRPEDELLVATVKARTARMQQRAEVPVDTERALAAVRRRIGADADGAALPHLRVEPGAGGRPVTRRSWKGVAFAAAAGLAAVAALAQFRGGPPVTPSREYRTLVGQRDSVLLPDGSRIVLAPDSRLTVAADFGASTREVTLDGAAYFDIAHDAAHPFTVHTAEADIRDIGTAFSVKTAPEGEVAVDVTHGIVALHARGPASRPVELRAGDRGVLAHEAVVVKRGTVTVDDVAWTRGLLTYRDASLAEVRADLRRWYGLDLRVPDRTLAARTLTASFRGDSAAAVLRVIALALGAEVQQVGDTVTLAPQGARRPMSSPP